VRWNIPLKVAMLESGLEQGEIAKLARIHQTRLSQIVRGRAQPTRSEQLRLAGVLQRPVRDVFPDRQSDEAVAS
jgi:transcriptional regulator with XRE-family HTH domain